MIELLGAIGWGLLACGAITHVWHHDRLRELLAMHLDRNTAAAVVMTTVEVGLAISIPVFVLTNVDTGLAVTVLGAFFLGLGFMAWIARLLRMGSDLPCACSFSGAPTSEWSLARATCVTLVGLLLWVPDVDPTTSIVDHIALFTVGWAIAAAIFVVPEAVTWPATSKALMARVDAHTES